MSVLCEYFAAPSDAAAAAVVDRLGGPADASGAPVTKTRGFFHRKAEPVHVPGGPVVAYPTVDGGGIEPVVQLATLEEILTGRSYDDVIDGLEEGNVVAERDGGQRLVVRLTPTLTAALVDSSADTLAAAALPWSQTEEFWGEADPAPLAGFLGRLADLARGAREAGDTLYCFVTT
ncbi:hypothetical protein [Cellulomonas sp. P5_C6]